MSIHRHDGARGPRWEVRWREGGRNRSRTFRSEDDALLHEAAMRRRNQLGAFAPSDPSPMLLADYIEHWVKTSGVEWAVTTLRTRGHLADKWIDPYIGHVPLRELGRARVREFRADIIRAGSPPTNTNNVMRVLSAALGKAEDEGLIPTNPCRRLGQVRQERTRRDALPEAILLRLIKEAPTPRDGAIVALAALAGLRPAEIVALTWGDIGGKLIDVHSSVQGGERGPVKNGRPRSVPIEPALNRALARAKGHTPLASDLVAPGTRGGYLNFGMWSRNVWRPLRDSVGANDAPFYNLRHSAISRWIAQGHDLMTVSGWAGHGPDVTLKVYAHQFQQSRQQAARSGPSSSSARRARSPRRGSAAPGQTA
jgi:integrase